jgi:hypothetical protein
VNAVAESPTSRARWGGNGTFPWRDARLWALTAYAAGLAAAANLAWGTPLPGHAPPTALVAVAAACVAWAVLAPVLHPRWGPWVAAAGRSVPLPAVVLAVLLAPPRPGPPFWTFLWTLALLLWVWWVSERATAALTASGAVPHRLLTFPWRSRGPGATASVLLGPLATLGCWEAACDLALRQPLQAWAAGRLWGGALAVVPCLLLVSWAAREDETRRAGAEGARVDESFAAGWWWAAVPAIAASVLVGSLWPRYRAPLQSGGLQHLVVGFVGRLGGPPPTAPVVTAAVPAGELVLLAAVIVALAWPGRGALRAMRRRSARPAARHRAVPPGPGPWLAAWWRRLRSLWAALRPRRTPLRGGRWWPATPAARGPSPPPAAAGRVPQAPSEARARVRAAYGHFLAEAARAGLRRAAADTPRRFLVRAVRRATAARFPLESLTALYEWARFSPHPVETDSAARAEADARAALYGVHLAVGARDTPGPGERLRWTPPRGVSRRNPD